MRFVCTAALKDLRILRRDPFGVLSWVGIPLCIGLLMRVVFGGGGAQPQGVLLVADQDKTVASRMLADAFGGEALGKMFTVERVNALEGRARIDRGHGSALLVIPKGLQDAFLNSRPYHLRLFTNAGERILPKIVEETLQGMVDGAFYVQRVGGDQLRGLDSGLVPSEADVALHAVQGRRLGLDIGRYLSPPLVDLETTVVEEKRNASTEDYFFPNMIFLALLLMANGLSTDIWKERTLGTLRRLAMTPAPIAAFLAGRVATVAIAYCAVGLAAVATAKYVAGVTVANLAAGAAWAAICGLAFYLLLLPLAVYSSGQRGADVRGNLLVFPLAMVGGCFFPFESMPEWMARIGKWTPNGMAVVQFKEVLLGSASLAHLAAVLALLAALGLLAFWLALRGLRGAFLR
jgi:ABC-type multidrug transport system permease subunit